MGPSLTLYFIVDQGRYGFEVSTKGELWFVVPDSALLACPTEDEVLVLYPLVMTAKAPGVRLLFGKRPTG